MNLSTRKRLAAKIGKRSKKKVKFDPERAEEIKESITKGDMRSLIKSKAVKIMPKRGISRGRARKNKKQRTKGKQRGHGSRKGTKNARLGKKTGWIRKVRSQRRLIHNLKKNETITNKTYRELYLKVKGGFFRSRKHISIYLEEHELIRKAKKR